MYVWMYLCKCRLDLFGVSRHYNNSNGACYVLIVSTSVILDRRESFAHFSDPSIQVTVSQMMYVDRRATRQPWSTDPRAVEI